MGTRWAGPAAGPSDLSRGSTSPSAAVTPCHDQPETGGRDTHAQVAPDRFGAVAGRVGLHDHPGLDWPVWFRLFSGARIRTVSSPLTGMRRETGFADGDARERPVFPARSAGLPGGRLGRRRRSGPVRSGVCARGAAGPAAVRAAHGPARVVAPCPVAGRLALGVARRAARAVCRRPGCAAAASRSSSPGGVPADLAGCAAGISRRPGDAGQVPRCPGLAPSRIRRWCAHRVPVDARGRVRAGCGTRPGT